MMMTMMNKASTRKGIRNLLCRAPGTDGSWPGPLRREVADTFCRTLCRRDAFTLVEVMVVTMMMAFACIMISGLWMTMGRCLTDTMAQVDVAQESHFALEVLRRDLGGFLPGEEKKEEDENKLVGRLATADGRLLLCFDGGKVNGMADWAKPDRVFVYAWKDGQLIRNEQTDKNESFIVSNHVTKFQPRQLGNGVSIELTIGRRDFQRTYRLVSQDP
jgi:type II secretory pathway pseudopilin PulG